MKTTHPFVAPVLGSTQSKVNMEAYEQAIDQYNEGNYLGAFYQLLDHLNPEFRTKYGNANGTEFHIRTDLSWCTSASRTTGCTSAPIS